jgi:hypothetical protein
LLPASAASADPPPFALGGFDHYAISIGPIGLASHGVAAPHLDKARTIGVGTEPDRRKQSGGRGVHRRR